jgi:hypothetical protein
MPGPSPVSPDLAAAAAAPPTRYQQYQAEKQAFMRGTPGRFKSGLLNTARGALQGLATGQGLAGAVGGAIGGFAGGVVNPKGIREQEFNERIRPQIIERFGYEDQARAQELAAEKAARENAIAEADINLKNAQAYKNRQPLPSKTPALFNTPGGTLDTSTRTIVPGTQPATKPPTAAELKTEPTSGKSAEQIAIESYENKGGDAYVLAHMPARIQQIIQKGTVTLNGKEQPASPDELRMAQQAFESAIKRQKETDIQYTTGSVRSRRLGSRQGANSSTPQRKAVVHADFVNHVANKLKISAEEAKRRIEADGYTVQ